jgi:hypothetical protein
MVIKGMINHNIEAWYPITIPEQGSVLRIKNLIPAYSTEIKGDHNRVLILPEGL